MIAPMCCARVLETARGSRPRGATRWRHVCLTRSMRLACRACCVLARGCSAGLTPLSTAYCAVWHRAWARDTSGSVAPRAPCRFPHAAPPRSRPGSGASGPPGRSTSMAGWRAAARSSPARRLPGPSWPSPRLGAGLGAGQAAGQTVKLATRQGKSHVRLPPTARQRLRSAMHSRHTCALRRRCSGARLWSRA